MLRPAGRSFKTSGSGGSDALPTEEVSVSFAKIETKHKERKADGSLQAPTGRRVDSHIRMPG